MEWACALLCTCNKYVSNKFGDRRRREEEWRIIFWGAKQCGKCCLVTDGRRRRPMSWLMNRSSLDTTHKRSDQRRKKDENEMDGRDEGGFPED
jgi:hypothetical protein